MIWIQFLKSIISVLHSDDSPRQLSAGVAMGAVIGLSPMNVLHNYVILFLIFILRVNIGAALLAVALFKIIAFAVDPVAHLLGYEMLVKIKALTPLWTRLYNMPIVPYTHFYNTIVLGSFVIGILLFVPIFTGTNSLILHYRTHWRAKVENMKIIKLFKLTSLFNFYDRIKGAQ